MTNILARRMEGVNPSTTLALNNLASEMKAKGVNVINMGVGEPDLPTPQNVCDAAIKAIYDGKTKYTPVNGIKELRAAVARKFLRDNNLQFDIEETIVSTGAKQSIFNAFMATINSGDEVIIPAPYWGSYIDMIVFAGGEPVVVECPISQKFKLLPEQLEQAITPRTKWLLLNSPSNPSGAVYSKSELQALAAILMKHPHVYVMSDDIYEHMIFDGKKFINIASVEPSLKPRTLIINGVSKDYSMTGWRLGYAAGPKELIDAMSIVQSHSTSCASSISQEAALEALNGPQDSVLFQCKSLSERRDLLLAGLSHIRQVQFITPEGAFYLFLDCRALLSDKVPNCATLSEYLLQEAHIAVVPGSVFGMDGFLRLSYAVPKSAIEDGCIRMKKAFSEI